MSKYRSLNNNWKVIIHIFAIIGIILSILYIFNLKPFGFTMLEPAYLNYLLVLFFSPVFLIYPVNKKSGERSKVPVYDIILFILAFSICLYFGINAVKGVYAGWEYSAPMFETILCIIMWGIIVEGIRRVSGLPLAIVCLVFSIFPMFADKMPGFMHGLEFSVFGAARAYYLGLEGVFGIPLRTVGTQLIGFMIFGAALEISGASDWLLRLTSSFFGRQIGGSSKIAVVTSGLFGSLSGSVISNIATIGTFAIPEMKKEGYESDYAGAVQACAATGGALMPPVMGAAAFVMASFLKIPYIEVAKAAALPAILYYLTLFVQSHTHAKLLGMKPKEDKEIPGKREAFNSGWYYIIAFVVLVYFMAYVKVETYAPYYAIVVLFALAMVKKETRITKDRIIKFIDSSAKILMELTAILAGIGLIVGALTMTGVAQAFSRELVSLVGDNVFLLLAACAFTSMILGMGMTVTACYTLLAVIVAPALVRLGIYEVAAHLFVLYWGLVSYITPPVAVGAITAAGVAGGSPMKTGFTAMKLAVASYIVPFAFAYDTNLIAHGTIFGIITSFAWAVFALIIIGYALEGYAIRGIGDIRSKKVLRILMFTCGLLMLFPKWNFKIFALVSYIAINFILKIIISKKPAIGA